MDYLQALERAVVYIEEHLGEPITVEEVARAAGYSYYHLTRQFSAVLGESVGGYLKKRRLADGAKKLLYTDRKVIDIALENGFESSEGFSRAFKAAYGVSPQIYRNNRLDLIIAAKDDLLTEGLRHRAGITVHPKVVEVPPIMAAGLRGWTTLRDNVLPQLWARFNEDAGNIPNRVPGGRGFGICESCSEGNDLWSMNRDVVFSEVAAVEVDSFAGLPERFVPKVIGGGRYAVFTHRGDTAKITDTFNYIWGTWFLSTDMELDTREDFELYDHRYLGYSHPKSEVDIYIPIK